MFIIFDRDSNEVLKNYEHIYFLPQPESPVGPTDVPLGVQTFRTRAEADDAVEHISDLRHNGKLVEYEKGYVSNLEVFEVVPVLKILDQA